MANRHKTRQGSIYIAVTGVAMMVAIIGFTSIHLSRLELRTSKSQQDDSYARVLAQSSVEMAIARIKEYGEPAWRANFTSGAENTITPDYNFKPLYFKYTDPDGNLNNGDNDPVVIEGIGRCGNSTYIYSVDYAASTTSGQQVAAVLKSNEVSADTFENVSSSAFYGQHFIPDLPAGVTSFNITHIEVYLDGHGVASATLDFKFHSSDGSGRPDVLIEALAIPESSLPPNGSPDYHQFNLTNATGLIPGQGYCFTLEQTGGGNAAIFHYNGNLSQTNTHMLRGGWGSWSTETSQSPEFRVHGTYTTSSASGEFTITPGSWQRVTAP